MFVFLLHVSFTLDYTSHSEKKKKKMSRKIYLQEAIELCQRSSDEGSDFDENVSKQEAGDSQLHETLYGEPNDKCLENEGEALTYENEQSDDGDAETDEPAAYRQTMS